MSRRVFVCVSGGVVNEVIVPPQADGTWSVCRSRHDVIC